MLTRLLTLYLLLVAAVCAVSGTAWGADVLPCSDTDRNGSIDVACPNDADRDGHGDAVDCNDANPMDYPTVITACDPDGAETDGYHTCLATGSYSTCIATATTPLAEGVHNYYVDCGAGNDSAAGTNVDKALVKCTASNTGAAVWLGTFDTTGTYLKDASITNTKFATTGVIGTVTGGGLVIQVPSAVLTDNQFNTGWILQIYDDSTKALKARICITDSEDAATDTVTVAADQSAHFEASVDLFDIVGDAACGLSVTGSGVTVDAAAIADAVCDERLRGHATRGTVCQAINAIATEVGIQY